MASLTSEIASAANFSLITSPETPLYRYDGREDCRSILDAVVRLEMIQPSDLLVVLRIMKIPRPDGKDTYLVMALRYPTGTGENWAVLMPAATHFGASTLDGKPYSGPIEDLDGAIFDSEGVTTHRGVALRSVDLKKGPPTHYDLDTDRRRVVSEALRILGVGATCCRQIYQDIPNEQKNALSEDTKRSLMHWYVDYAQIPKVKIKNLKKLVFDISKALPKVPNSKIRDALRKAGFQFPRSPSRD